MRNRTSIICLTLLCLLLLSIPVQAATPAQYTNTEFNYRIKLPAGLSVLNPTPEVLDMAAVNPEYDAFMFSLGLLSWTKKIDITKVDWSSAKAQAQVAMEQALAKNQAHVEIAESNIFISPKEKLPRMELLFKFKNPKQPDQEFHLLSYIVLADNKMIFIGYGVSAAKADEWLPRFRESFASYKNLRSKAA